MSKSKKKTAPQAKNYSADAIALRIVLGVLLIATGVLIGLSCIMGRQDGIFKAIGDFARGVCGGLAYGLPVLLIWAGLIACVSAQRKPHIRPFFIICLIFILLCGFISCITVSDYSTGRGEIASSGGKTDFIMNEIWRQAEADIRFDFFKLIELSFDMKPFNLSGGSTGFVISFPFWKLSGPVFGAVLIAFLMIPCVLWLFHFSPKRFIRKLRERSARVAEKQDERQRQREQAVWLQENQTQPAVQNFTPVSHTITQQPQPAQYTAGFAPVPEESSYTPPLQPEKPKQNRFFSRIFGNPIHEEEPEEAPLRVSRRHDGRTLQPVSETPVYADNPVSPYQPPADSQSASEDIYAAPVRPAQIEAVVTAEPNPTKPPKQEPARPMQTAVASESETEPPAATRRHRRSTSSESSSVQKPLDSWQESKDSPPWDEDIPTPVKPVVPVIRDQTRGTGEAISIKPAKTEEPLGGRRKQKPEQGKQQRMYIFPDMNLLNQPDGRVTISHEEDAMRARCLEETLASFKVDANVRHITHGPAVSRFELEIAQGIKVNKITSLSDNIAMNMEAKSVRIEAPIPGKSLVGVEVPNRTVSKVTLREILESSAMRDATDPLTVALGRDIAGTPIVCNLSKMPHILIAGATGSGKSVCINAIINSLLYRCTPEQVRLILVDPKVVELQCYNGCPHLLLPVVSDPHKASAALAWAVDEMMQRYNKFKKVSVRNIDGYNAHLPEGELPMPRLVIIIDELADLMMVCKRDVEERICRIAQLARAAGIHLIVATQRPSVDVITGLIKANIPSRIAFKVTSQVDSRTILDGGGAEHLLGWGDMLYKPMGSFTPTRIQGCFLSDDEVNEVTEFIRSTCPAEYDPEIIELLEHADEDDGSANPSTNDFAADESANPTDGSLLAQCIEIAVQDGQVSTSMLQRRLRVGYSRAGRLVDEMEKRGIVSQQDGSKPRVCLISREEFEEMKASGSV